MSRGSRTPQLYGWRARRLRVALTPEDWRLIEAGAMHRGHTVSRFLGDVLSAWAADQRLKEERIDAMAKGRGLIAPLKVPS